jgi:hypothetical protein
VSAGLEAPGPDIEIRMVDVYGARTFVDGRPAGPPRWEFGRDPSLWSDWLDAAEWVAGELAEGRL